MLTPAALLTGDLARKLATCQVRGNFQYLDIWEVVFVSEWSLMPRLDERPNMTSWAQQTRRGKPSSTCPDLQHPTPQTCGGAGERRVAGEKLLVEPDSLYT